MATPTPNEKKLGTSVPPSIIKIQSHSENPIDIGGLVSFCADEARVEKMIKEHMYLGLLSDDLQSVQKTHFFKLPHLRFQGRKNLDTVYVETKVILEDLSKCMFGYLFQDLMDTFKTIFQENSEHSMREKKWKIALADYTKSHPFVDTGKETFIDYMVSNLTSAEDIKKYESKLKEVFGLT